jgi:nicotinate-nucleotide adenylyltransferase
MRMAGLLVAGDPGLDACSMEIERGGPSYTVDTLDAIHAGQPDAELTFIVGADAASTLGAWREPGRLLELADLAVARRAGATEDGLRETIARLASGSGSGRQPRLRFLDMPLVEISSSEARGRASRGDPIEDLVGPAVAGYIAEHGLYREPTEASA